MLWPTCGIRVNINIGQKEAKGVAIVMPLPNIVILIGNDLLRQFGYIEIHYGEQADDDYYFFNMTPSQQTSIVLSQDIVVTAKSVVPVATSLVPGQTLGKKKFFVVEPSTPLSVKKGVSLGHSIITSLDQILLTNLSNQPQVLIAWISLGRIEEMECGHINAIIPREGEALT